MKTFKHLLPLFCLSLFFLTGCIKDPTEDSKLYIFDLLWTEYDENYAAFDVRNVDWDSIKNSYRPQVSESMTEADFFILCSNMIYELNDGHNDLIDQNGEEYFPPEADTIETKDVFIQEVVDNKYLEAGFDIFEDREIVHNTMGMIKNENIAYLQIWQMEEIDGGWPDKIDAFFEDVKDSKAMIIDLRINGGGFTPIGLYLANRFVSTVEWAFSIQTKNGPGPDDFDEDIAHYVGPEGSSQYTKPVVILTDDFTASNAEDFTICLKTQEHVTQMGNISSGIFSNKSLQKFFPNGWSTTYTHQLYTYPDGTSPEGMGLIPDVEVPYTKEDWENGSDKVLEAAIEFLK